MYKNNLFIRIKGELNDSTLLTLPAQFNVVLGATVNVFAKIGSPSLSFIMEVSGYVHLEIFDSSLGQLRGGDQEITDWNVRLPRIRKIY